MLTDDSVAVLDLLLGQGLCENGVSLHDDVMIYYIYFPLH